MSSVYVSPSMRMSENHLIFDDEDEDDNENEYDDGDENVNELRYNADRRGGGLEKFVEEDWEVSSPLLGLKSFQRNAMRQENSNGGDDTMNMDNGLDQMQCDNYGSESGETEEEAKERISLDIWNSVDELGGESTGKSTDVGVNQVDVGEWFVGDGGEEEDWF
ncbi:hypothetical protein HDU99_000290 [Rhizoclosmatium hyalinum]|nr:hypothetical protein HDU99_000290 [Rhizoclosmatium hyalinum]